MEEGDRVGVQQGAGLGRCPAKNLTGKKPGE